MRTAAITFKGVYFADLEIIGESDWKYKNREPGPNDFLKGHAFAISTFVYKAIENHPNFVDEENPKPLFQLLVELAVKEIKGNVDRELESEAVEVYVKRFGMAQLLKNNGLDEKRIMEQLDNFKKSERTQL